MAASQIFRLTRNLILHVHRTHDAFDPAKHPRGHQGNTGQFARGGGGSKSTPGTQRQQQQTRGQSKPGRESLKGDFAARIQPQSDKQDVKDLDDLYTKAKRDEPGFVQTIKNVAASVGGEAQFTPPQFAEPGTTLKLRTSAQRKMNSQFGGDASQLKDILRATVVAKKIEDVRAAANKFIEENKGSIVSIKDRIVNPAAGGYRDIQVNFRTPSGLISELQFNAEPMITAKLGDGHRIYEAVRKLKAKDSHDHDRMLDMLDKKSAQLYEAAYQAGGNGNWG
jgi:hypothetical protein